MKEWPRIREEKNGSWVVDCGWIDNHRRVYRRKTQELAEDLADHLRTQQQKYGEQAMNFSLKQLATAAQAYEMLGDGSLLDAVSFYNQHHKARHYIPSAQKVYEMLLQDMRNMNRRQRSIDTAECSLKRFLKICGDRPVDQITPDMIEHFLSTRHTLSLITQSNDQRYLKVFFNFAKKRGFIEDTPTDRLQSPSIEEKMPEVLSVEHAEMLLRRAQGLPRVQLQGAILLFAGLRSSEAERLSYGEIQRSRGIILINPEVSKCRQSRYIEMEDNLIAWLDATWDASITDDMLVGRREFDQYRKSLVAMVDGLEWSSNITRHSFSTYHCAKYGNVSKTTSMMGNSSSVLFKHYRNLATREEGEEYFGIMP